MNGILKALAAPFPPGAVDWRVGSTNAEKTRGMALAYIDARTVQDRLNEVCGALWQCSHVASPDGKKVTCSVGVKIGDEWIWRSDGAGDTDYEAEKGSYSDSFKRAAVKWGIGRYLYDLDAPWVAITAMGKSFKIADGEMPRLHALASGKSAPAPKAPSPGTASLPPQIAEFFGRDSYELPGSDLFALASKLAKATEYAPTEDHLLKLEDDNKDHIAALKNGSDSEWRKLQAAFTAARKRVGNIAA